MTNEKMPKMTAKEMLAAGIDRSKIKAEITTWHPKAKDVLVSSKGNTFKIHFERAMPDIPNVGIYDDFYVNKSNNKNNYEDHLITYARYIDFFVQRYDKKGELLVAYLKIKYAIDRLHLFNRDNPHALRDLIYEVMFTPSICQEICDLVEDNYLDKQNCPV